VSAEAAIPELVIATGNVGKLREIREILDDARFRLCGLERFSVEMPGEGDDYLANAIAKAREVARATGLAAVGDDSGLEVDALGGRPGPLSARYGGQGLDDQGRVAHLLHEMEGVAPAARSARFVCFVALARPDGRIETARGVCPGTILAAPEGQGGFGYDPVFRPQGYAASMAGLPAETKNRISHRGRALLALQPAVIDALGLAS
jgi:XTP/dITP diphosphohydrolase